MSEGCLAPPGDKTFHNKFSEGYKKTTKARIPYVRIRHVVSGCVKRNAFCVIPYVRNTVRFISLSASGFCSTELSQTVLGSAYM